MKKNVRIEGHGHEKTLKQIATYTLFPVFAKL